MPPSTPLLRACAVFLSACGALDAAEVQIGAHQFTLPDGYEIELVAGPPLVDRPIAAAFDEQGRLYVSDSSGSNDKTEKQLEEKPHRVVRLEDSDGDGRFDKSTIFADKLMFPEGVMWRDGSLYVGAPPSIWKLTDTDGDGVADQRVEWFEGKTLTGCANDLHGPYPGPDGFIYWCKGAFAEQTHKLGNGRTITDRAAHIFRCRADGSDFDSVMSGGMDNPVDVAFTREGEPIFTSTFIDLSGGGKRDGLGHAIYGGVFPKTNSILESITRTGDLLPAMTHFGPGAPCGFTRVESAGLGDDVRDNFFACLFNLHKVTRHALEPVGATFRTRDSDFVVSNNTDFHPTDVVEDADGSLLIVDTGGWYKLCCPTSQLAKPDVLGAIYRVKRKGAPKIEDPRGLKMEWSQLPAIVLAALLADRNPAVAERAGHILAQDGEVSVLAKALSESTDAAARERALWLLSRIGGEQALTPIRAALNDLVAGVRQTAAKICGLHRDSASLDPLIASLKSESPHLRRVAAEALGRIGDARAVPALLAASAAVSDDRFLEHAFIFALIEIGAAAETAEGLRDDRSAATRRIALMALGEMGPGALSPKTVLPLLGSSDAMVKSAALWVAGRHADWGAELAGFLRTRIEAASLPKPERSELESLIASVARDSAVQQMIVAVLRGSAPGAHSIVLRAIANSGLTEIPSEWIGALTSVLERRDPATIEDAIAAANIFVTRKGGASLAPALLSLARDPTQRDEIRLAALAVVPSVAPDSALFALLLGQLAPDRAAMIRAATAAVLAKAKLDDPQRDALIDLLPRLGPLELTRILPAFEHALSEAQGRRLLDALRNTPALAGGQAAMLRAVFARLPAKLQPDADSLLARVSLDTVQQRAKLDAIAAELPAGDARRGQLVFNSAKTACTVCHSVGYLGGGFGPDLTSIGQVRNERDLLEAVVFPSASFVRSYEPSIVRMTNGTELTGIVRGESSDAVVLAMGPGIQQRVIRTEIAEIRPGTISMMPQGFDQMLSRQELSDLVAFLKASVRRPH